MIFILINQIDVPIRFLDMISVGFSRNMFAFEVKVLVNGLTIVISRNECIHHCLAR